MATFLIIENPKLWPLEIPGVELVSAREYLTSRRFVDLRRAKVFNLCRAYSYQSVGYYVSLLATARGHKALPSVTTLQDLRNSPMLRIASEGLDREIQRAMAHLHSDRFELSIYLGRNMARRYDRLCQALFNHFPAPMLRAELVRTDQWRIQSLRPIASKDIPESHRPFVIEQAERFFARRVRGGSRRPRYELAVLFDPSAVDAPSDVRALERFARAAKKHDIRTSLVDKSELGRIGEYDALFIRETTAVNHHTYRFARRAEAEGLIVVDDPESIVRCTNKVYQAELFERHRIPSPRTIVVHRDNASDVGRLLGFPCVLKRPDSSFSAGVTKVSSEEELVEQLAVFHRTSELVVAQEWAPSTFDWRVGVLGGRALFVCKYHMARGHWQIQRAGENDGRSYGRVETFAVDAAPSRVVRLAVRAAQRIGNGLYGVDIKDVSGRLLVMEINDNPNIDAGYEDAVLKGALYDQLARHFIDRLEARGGARGQRG